MNAIMTAAGFAVLQSQIATSSLEVSEIEHDTSDWSQFVTSSRNARMAGFKVTNCDLER